MFRPRAAPYRRRSTNEGDRHVRHRARPVPEEVAGFFQRLVGGVDAVHPQVDHLDAAGAGRVLVEGVDHYVVDGEPVEVPIAHVVLVRDGAISGFTEYADVAALTRLLGTAA